MRTLIWLRSDLRVHDNPALFAGCREADRGVAAVFLLAAEQWKLHAWGAPKIDFLLRSLGALSRQLERLRIPLLVRNAGRFDAAPAALLDVARELGCDAVHFNREHEVNERRRDEAVGGALRGAGLRCRAHDDQTVLPLGTVLTGAGSFYTVFTPFRRAWTKRIETDGVPEPLPSPGRRAALVRAPDPVPAELPGFEPEPRIAALWPAGEAEAERRLDRFLDERVGNYDRRRDIPAEAGTSELSPYLALGALSPRTCLARAAEANGGRLTGGCAGPETWIGELVWREFYRNVLAGFPKVSMGRAFRTETERIRWRKDERTFAAWCEGRTGYPIVDAGMRQLASTGWMHNRLRMIVASFLSKDLLVDWRRGERFFMEHLVDGDLANNNGAWQWAASTGTDAQPYFRIFNPSSQSRKFDPEGAFIRRWVPEMGTVPGAALHDPTLVTPSERRALRYPAPVVDHAKARERALIAFRATSSL